MRVEPRCRPREVGRTDKAGQSSETPVQPHWLVSLALFVAIALLWVALFRLNRWMFSATDVTAFISWVFLPAAIRMLAIMVCDWVGAAGLFAGALITAEADPVGGWVDDLALAFLSSIGPLLAVWLCTRLLKLPADLTGLSSKQLLVFSAMGAFFNALPHNIYFYMSGRMMSPLEGFTPMFVGDLVGTAIVLYAASLVIRLSIKRA